MATLPDLDTTLDRAVEALSKSLPWHTLEAMLARDTPLEITTFYFNRGGCDIFASIVSRMAELPIVDIVSDAAGPVHRALMDADGALIDASGCVTLAQMARRYQCRDLKMESIPEAFCTLEAQDLTDVRTFLSHAVNHPFHALVKHHEPPVVRSNLSP